MAIALPFEALPGLVGRDVATSGWFTVDQHRIAVFADATDDHQWIHLDPERCQSESPFGQTVAHGFLTLSLLPAMLADSIAIDGMRVGINYGLNKVRFPGPLPAGSRVRSHWHLAAATAIDGAWQLAWHVTLEAEGKTKPVCVAEFLFRAYP